MKSFLLFAATALLLAGTLGIALWAGARPPEPLAQPLESINRHIGNWVAVDDPAMPRSQELSLKATSYLSRTYWRGSRQLNLFIAFYANPRAGESMHSPKHCLPGGGWEVLQQDTVTVPVDRERIPVNRYVIQRNAERSLVLYWYQSRERIVATESMGKFWLIWDSARRGHIADSIVRIVIPEGPDSLQDGIRFATAVIPEVQSCFASRRQAVARQ